MLLIEAQFNREQMQSRNNKQNKLVLKHCTSLHLAFIHNNFVYKKHSNDKTRNVVGGFLVKTNTDIFKPLAYPLRSAW